MKNKNIKARKAKSLKTGYAVSQILMISDIIGEGSQLKQLELSGRVC